jgi:predicted RNA-binding protein with TRAM domain
MTRQNVTDGPREILTNRCPVCAGDGVVVSDATHALEVERELRAVAKGSRVQAFRIAVHPRVLALLAGPGGSRLEDLEAAARRRFFLVPAATNGHVHLDHFEVLGQGKVDALKPETPVEEGAKLEVKLVELGLHDPTSGVAKVDQYEIVVANAAKLVGKKVSVVVGRALDGVAYATLADAPVPSTVPITFEAEAEKPTRAPRGKKEAEELLDAEVEIAEAEVAETDEGGDVDLEADVVEEPDVAEEAAADGQPKKKRTRRGSRGGRGRKTAAAAPSPEAVDAEPAEESDGRPSPRIHVPPLELDVAAAPALMAVEAPDAAPASEGAVAEPGEDGQPKRKRSRRGSRGGRRLRKPVANGDGTSEAVADVADVAESSEAEVADSAQEAPEYVPMSEWIDDFESRSRS